jgi:hypothetical protein
MKKKLLFVFVWLALTALWGGSLFASGIFGRPKDKGPEALVPEVVERDDYPLRQNANVRRASGDVYAWPATVLNPEDSLIPPPVYAISGVKGQAIGEIWEAVDIIVTLRDKASFNRRMLEGEDVSNWIPNLPEGLEARVHRVKKGDKTVKIYISGTPKVTAKEVIQVTVPGTILSTSQAQSFTSPSKAESDAAWLKSLEE